MFSIFPLPPVKKLRRSAKTTPLEPEKPEKLPAPLPSPFINGPGTIKWFVSSSWPTTFEEILDE